MLHGEDGVIKQGLGMALFGPSPAFITESAQ